MFPKKAPSGSSLALLLLLIVGLPTAAAAQEDVRPHTLRPALSMSQEWDDNVFLTERRERSSWVTHVRPTLDYVYRTDRLTALLQGGVAGRKVWSYNSENAIDRFGKWDLDWEATSRLTLRTDGRVEWLESRDESTDGDEVLRQGRPDQDVLDVGAGADYTLDGRTLLTLDFEHFDSRYEATVRFPEDQVQLEGNPLDRRTNTGTLGLTRAVTASDNLTAQLQAVFSEFDNDDISASPRVISTGDELARDSESDIFGATIGWRRVWGPAWTTNIYAGTRLLRSEVTRERVVSIYELIATQVAVFRANATTGLSDRDTDRGWGFIGGLTVSRELPKGKVVLSYARETRPSSSSISSSVDSNSFTGEWTHRLTDRLRFTAFGRMRFNESASDFDVFIPLGDRGLLLGSQIGGLNAAGCRIDQFRPTGLAIDCPTQGRSELDTEELDLVARLEWQVRRRLNAHAGVRFADRDSDGTRQLAEYDRLRLMFGFRYSFDVGL